MTTDLPVISVTELNHLLKELVEASFPWVQVAGEVSNASRAASGHVYLTIKDESAQIRAIIWRNAASRIPFEIADGLQVIAGGPVQVYPARGQYQLIVEQLIPEGVGALELAFRQLKDKLAAAGLFDPEHKRELPKFPRRIAIITSPTGAAIRDLLQVITRRWPSVDIVVLPVAVQGEGAAAQIARAMETVPRIPDVDVVIAGRGGGSLEDLWAFNEEIVARAIHACPVPVISAVGHEVDVTIADFVADCRALTPSEAGELVVPSQIEILDRLLQTRSRLRSLLRERAQRVRTRLDLLAGRRVFVRPVDRIRHLVQQVDQCENDLRRGLRHVLDGARNRTTLLASTLDALSPLKVLGRGYSITCRTATSGVVMSIGEIDPGDRLTTRVSDGSIVSQVESTVGDDGQEEK